MKNITLKLLLCVFVMLSITSCTVYRDYNRKYITAPILDLSQTQVTNGILETDLEMIGEVTASYTISNKNSSNLEEGVYVVDDVFLFRFESDITKLLYTKAKATVLNLALEKAKCDMILAPIYKLEVKGQEYSHNGGATYYPSAYAAVTYTISVKGFGANIKGVKQIKTN